MRFNVDDCKQIKKGNREFDREQFKNDGKTELQYFYRLVRFVLCEKSRI